MTEVTAYPREWRPGEQQEYAAGALGESEEASWRGGIWPVFKEVAGHGESRWGEYKGGAASGRQKMLSVYLN